MLETGVSRRTSVYRFRLAALVILPDHWHGLLRPDGGAVKRKVLTQLGVKQSFWQARFLDHRIRNDDDFEHHAQYIRMNPVKHGYVVMPEEWAWLFFHPRPFDR